MNANEMWRALIRDYYLGQGAYIYINKERGKVKSLHYVDEEHVQITDYIDPIFKGYDIAVLGQGYLPHQFIKILRNTKNGANGISLIKENALILSVAYCGLVFENALVKKGGNKKGFIKSENKLSEPEMDLLKSSWKKLYSNKIGRATCRERESSPV